MENMLVIPIAYLLTARQINEIMEKLLVQDDELFNKIIHMDDDSVIEQDGFVFNNTENIEEIAQDDAKYFAIVFEKQVDAFFEVINNRISIFQRDFIIIEKTKNGRRIILDSHVREPFILLRDFPANIKIGNSSVDLYIDFDFKVAVTDKNVVVDMRNFTQNDCVTHANIEN